MRYNFTKQTVATHFLKKHAATAEKPISTIAPDALQALTAYDFPGNVQELESIIEIAVSLETTEVLQQQNLPDFLFTAVA